MGQFHWDPEAYLELMRAEVPLYERLQDELVAATGDTAARRILDLGTGTGETARRLLAAHPEATLVGVDDSAEMLARAATVLPAGRVRLQVGRIEGPLPPGPFDLVTSALCVHHLDGPGKAAFFARLPDALAPGGRLVIADVVVPADPGDVVTPVDGDYDLPSSVPDQLRWLEEAGFEPRVAWEQGDLAVLAAEVRVTFGDRAVST